MKAATLILLMLLAACSRPPERNIWREMMQNGEL